MNPESSLKLQALNKLPVCITKEKITAVLGIATHNIPPLVRAGLLQIARPSGALLREIFLPRCARGKISRRVVARQSGGGCQPPLAQQERATAQTERRTNTNTTAGFKFITPPS